VTYINEHKHLFGVEPICRTLSAHGWPIASGTYRAAVRRLPSTRARRDAWLAEHIRRVHAGNYGVYGGPTASRSHHASCRSRLNRPESHQMRPGRRRSPLLASGGGGQARDGFDASDERR
jgi:hypothetical protein